MGINIVLVEPEIPQNTGNIARTCAATGANLHLVKPLGFSVDDRYLKRAGLDYWSDVKITYYDSFNELREKYKENTFFYATTKAQNSYTEVSYPEDCFIVFGKETAGLPEELLVRNKEWCIRIPMKSDIRSLNLSNSVAIIVYEALRQNNFIGFNTKGNLTKYSWR
ncbi:MAG TPA: tRNA (uridine(34)/cytosine(34)/5-carboxymethylaminomethyluridine(34)-2'-O)-methyltransferase TrmL [Acetivibrio sp.]|nr:tRNA (uridine(34)/cytosine(34)/5-carboxymethylaminomethyluridine(34)-2'-O)-methyltransferase TrmL [Acetivibrio sp.]